MVDAIQRSDFAGVQHILEQGFRPDAEILQTAAAGIRPDIFSVIADARDFTPQDFQEARYRNCKRHKGLDLWTAMDNAILRHGQKATQTRLLNTYCGRSDEFSRLVIAESFDQARQCLRDGFIPRTTDLMAAAYGHDDAVFCQIARAGQFSHCDFELARAINGSAFKPPEVRDRFDRLMTVLQAGLVEYDNAKFTDMHRAYRDQPPLKRWSQVPAC